MVHVVCCIFQSFTQISLSRHYGHPTSTTFHLMSYLCCHGENFFYIAYMICPYHVTPYVKHNCLVKLCVLQLLCLFVCAQESMHKDDDATRAMFRTFHILKHFADFSDIAEEAEGRVDWMVQPFSIIAQPSTIIAQPSIYYHSSTIYYHVSTIYYHVSIIYHHSSTIYYHVSTIYYHVSIIYHHSSTIYYHVSIIYHHSSSISCYGSTTFSTHV